nr:MAG TPA_asm: hypothetical protein [Caudoviricetes sp.]
MPPSIIFFQIFLVIQMINFIFVCKSSIYYGNIQQYYNF